MYKRQAARLGTLDLPHGRVPTPIFMPVGTQGSVKTMHPQDLETLGARIILGLSLIHIFILTMV